MSKPQEEAGIQVGSVPYTMPPNAQPPNAVPLHYQMNVQPGYPNVYQSAPMWTVSPGAPNVVYATAQPNAHIVYAAAQPPAPGFQVPVEVNPQATGQSQSQQIFLKGKPKALGIVLIVMGILEIGFGISLPFITGVSVTLFSGIPFWGAIFYITAGALSITAEKGLELCQIKGSLALSILSSIFSLTAIILNVVDFVVMDCYYYGYKCEYDTGAANTIVAFILVFNLLVFCVSVSLSAFGCRAIEKVPSNNSPVFVIQNGYVQNPAFPTNSPIPQGPLPPPYLSQSDEKVAPQ